jgi:hypothetical protein
VDDGAGVRLRTITEDFTFGQTFTFIPMGDFHLGSGNCDEKALCKWIKRIEDDPDARWVGMGDLVESIAPDDVRWNPLCIDPTLTVKQTARIAKWYVEKLAEVISPIIGKCWSLNDGNHEDKFNSRYFCNILDDVRERLGAPADLYQEWSSGTKVVFEDRHGHRRPVKIFQQHGWQSGRKDGAKINGLDDLIAVQTGYDIYLVAHSHSRLVKTFTSLTYNKAFDDLVAPVVFAGHTASFLRTYQLNKVGYGEKKSYPPTSIKPIRFSLTPTQEGVEIEGTI